MNGFYKIAHASQEYILYKIKEKLILLRLIKKMKSV